MPEPESGETDTRPNGWDSLSFNWAKMYLTGFKIHHMNEKNWARNAHVEISGWQMSDNTRSFGLSKKNSNYNLIPKKFPL